MAYFSEVLMLSKKSLNFPEIQNLNFWCSLANALGEHVPPVYLLKRGLPRCAADVYVARLSSLTRFTERMIAKVSLQVAPGRLS